MNFNSILTIVILFFASCGETEQADNSPRKAEILFLGHDSRHHDSEKYMPILAGSFASAGINLTYTSKLEDLNSSNLSKYDALMIYANHDSISSSQEKAMLDFVKEGNGLIPIHCASYCFRNSEEYVKLNGGQFKSHETGTFTAEIINAEHPITKGLEVFETWDETYVHTKHNEERTVLMERVEGDKREPWTWVKEYGKGRMFYTAYGHDEKTWTNPGFHELMKRGTLWALGDRVNGLRSQLKLPSQQYELRESNIANYERRETPLPFQLPMDQGESEKLIQVPSGFDIELFAKEPDIINPIAFTWDEKGRLWVIETVDYPNEITDYDKGDDRIKICEDTDGDGRADKFTVFADGLNIPTGIVMANGGIIISVAPNFLFLKDTDGDDVADVREVIMDGWGKGDTHAGPSNLKYGFDNQIWGTVGYSGFKSTIGGEEFDFYQGFYRFKPDASNFEIMARTSNNTWGLGFSETFDVFGSTANNAHSWYMGIPLRYLDKIELPKEQGSRKIADYYAFHPITPNVRQVDVFGGFTAAAGHNLYTARDFPKEYWNRVALVAEPTGHLLAKGVLEKSGAGFVTKDGWNLLASSDEWVSPVHAEVGPDGAVWVSDWYNFIIQHNPTPSPERGGYQAENGEGNAHVNPLRDKQHGRIYRIVSRSAEKKKPFSLDKDDSKSLIEGLSHNNLFWRLTAQRLLVERGNQDVLSELYSLVKNQSIDELGLNPGALHALWTIHGLGAFTGNNQEAIAVAYDALKHKAAGVRKAAVQIIPNTWESRNEMQASGILNDSDPHTQLAALLKMSDMPASEEVGQLLYEVGQEKLVSQDLWLSQAVIIAASAHKKGYFDAFDKDENKVVYDEKWYEEPPKLPSIWRPSDEWERVTNSWETMKLPGTFEENGLEDFDGTALFYRTFNLKQKGQMVINLGTIDETDRCFVNGHMIGESRNDVTGKRQYLVSEEQLKIGENYIIVWIEDRKGTGGFTGNQWLHRHNPYLHAQSNAQVRDCVNLRHGFQSPVLHLHPRHVF